MFGSILKNDRLKAMLLKKFTDQARADGIKKILISIGDDGTIDANPLQDDSVIISKQDLDFYTNFVNSNKDRL